MDDHYEPSFLADSTNEYRKHVEIASKNSKVILKQFDQLFSEFLHDETKMNWDIRLKDLLSSSLKHSRELQILEAKIDKTQLCLESMAMENNTLKVEVSNKNDELIKSAQEMTTLKEKSLRLQLDYENIRSNTTQRYHAIISAKNIYKKWLGCHIRVLNSEDSSEVVLFSFGYPSLKNSEARNSSASVKLQRVSENKWKLLETVPSVASFHRAVKVLDSSQDIVGLLVFLKQKFKV